MWISLEDFIPIVDRLLMTDVPKLGRNNEVDNGAEYLTQSSTRSLEFLQVAKLETPICGVPFLKRHTSLKKVHYELLPVGYEAAKRIYSRSFPEAPGHYRCSKAVKKEYEGMSSQLLLLPALRPSSRHSCKRLGSENRIGFFGVDTTTVPLEEPKTPSNQLLPVDDDGLVFDAVVVADVFVDAMVVVVSEMRWLLLSRSLEEENYESLSCLLPQGVKTCHCRRRRSSSSSSNHMISHLLESHSDQYEISRTALMALVRLRSEEGESIEHAIVVANSSPPTSAFHSKLRPDNPPGPTRSYKIDR